MISVYDTAWLFRIAGHLLQCPAVLHQHGFGFGLPFFTSYIEGSSLVGAADVVGTSQPATNMLAITYLVGN